MPRLPNTTLFSVPSLTETAVIGFDLEGIAVSSGSACSSGSTASHVLEAMGSAGTGEAVRLSLGWSTTEERSIALLRLGESSQYTT